MGGQSFKCPLCDKWFLHKGALGDHLKDKHELKNFIIKGIAGNTYVKEET
jgi:hypothetical protein